MSQNTSKSRMEKVVVDGNSIEVEKIKDFSPQVSSLQTKFFSVSLVSLFVTVFDLDEESKFFGVSANDVHERMVEFGFFIVAFLLGFKYVLRVLEERDAFLQLGKLRATLTSNVKKQGEYLLNSHKGLLKTVEEKGFFTREFVEQFDYDQAKLEKILNNPRSELDPRMDLIRVGHDTLSDLSSLRRSFDKVSDTFLNEMKKYEKTILALVEAPTNHRGIRKIAITRLFRIGLFDLALPLVMLISISVAVAFPENVRACLGAWFGE